MGLVQVNAVEICMIIQLRHFSGKWMAIEIEIWAHVRVYVALVNEYQHTGHQQQQ